MPATAPEPSVHASASCIAARQAIVVAAQRGGVRQKEVRHQHRLRLAQVRVRRHQRLAGVRGAIGERGHDLGHGALQHRDLPPQIEPQVERHLLVARAAGVQAPAGVADALDELTLDEAVHVFVGTGHPLRVAAALFEDGGERAHDGGDVVARQHAGGAERLGPRDAAGDVVLEERAVEAERDAEVEGRRIGGRLEAAVPERRHERTIIAK